MGNFHVPNGENGKLKEMENVMKVYISLCTGVCKASKPMLSGMRKDGDPDRTAATHTWRRFTEGQVIVSLVAALHRLKKVTKPLKSTSAAR